MNTRGVAVLMNMIYHVSADTDMFAIAIMICSNRTQQARETHGCIDRNEASNLAFLFTICHTDCRCDVRNSSEAEQT